MRSACDGEGGLVSPSTPCLVSGDRHLTYYAFLYTHSPSGKILTVGLMPAFFARR